jgi:hypothetical protein
MVHAVLRRTGFWETPIAAAYCFGMLTLLCLWRSLHSRRTAFWLAAGGACFGLAVGSRPNYVVGAIAFIPIVIWAWRRTPSRSRWPQALALGAGLGAVMLGLFWYNAARFGNPFEFGTSYMVNASYEAKAKHFSADFLGFNAYVYFFAPAQWSRYFPFVEMIRPPQAPPQYYGMEFSYGLLANLPFAWLAALSPLAWRKRPPTERDLLRAFVLAVAGFFAAITFLLLLRWSAAARYMVDFTPSLMLLACVGLLGAERAASGWARTAVQVVSGAAAAFSIFVGVMLSFQLHELLRQLDPSSFQRLAHAFDTPVYWAERLAGVRHGPLDITVRFPRGRVGRVEPLVTTGWVYDSDHLFVEYLDDRRLRIGFDHLNGGRIWSRPMEIDYGVPHALRVEMGSFYPPRAHPIYDGMRPAAIEAATRSLRVILDGALVLSVARDFYDASPEGISLGRDPTGIYGTQFSGRILDVRAARPLPPIGIDRAYGPIDMDLAFPSDIPDPGAPLIATGLPGRGDVLRVRSVRPGVLRFGYDHPGSGLWESGDIAVGGPPVHSLRVRLPSLLGDPVAQGQRAVRASLMVQLDGRVVWAQSVPFYPAAPGDVWMGRNTVGVSSCVSDFAWPVARIERFAGGDAISRGGTGPIRLRVQLAQGREGRREPLIVTGTRGRADLLSLQYLDGGHIRFGLDHWISGFRESEALPVDYSKIHELEIRLPTLDWPRPADGGEFSGEATILLDGAVAWRTEAKFYRAAPENLSIAANSIGGSTCEPDFAGGIVSIEWPAERLRGP